MQRQGTVEDCGFLTAAAAMGFSSIAGQRSASIDLGFEDTMYAVTGMTTLASRIETVESWISISSALNQTLTNQVKHRS